MKKEKGICAIAVKPMLAGIGVSIGIMLIMLGLNAWLIIGGRVGESSSAAAVWVTVVISVFTGSYMAVKILHGKPVIAFEVGIGVWATLLCIGWLFFDGTSENVFTHLIMTVLGSGAAFLFSLKKSKRKMRIKKSTR